MQNLLLAATIPFDCYARPILFSDGALIGLIVLPANAVADIKKSGLVAGHLCTPYSNYDHHLRPGEIVRFDQAEDSRCLR
jgi:hypothetical protein